MPPSRAELEDIPSSEPPQRRLAIGRMEFRMLTTGTLLLWGLTILLLRRKANLDIDTSDVEAGAQISAGLSAIALALLAIVQQISPGDRYFSLSLGFLATWSALATALGLAALMVHSTILEQPQLTIWIALIAFGLVVPIAFGRKNLDLLLPFAAPVFVICAIPLEGFLAVSSMVVLIGAAIGLLAATGMFLIATWRMNNSMSQEPTRTAEPVTARPPQPSEIDLVVEAFMEELAAEQQRFRSGARAGIVREGRNVEDGCLNEVSLRARIRSRRMLTKLDHINEAFEILWHRGDVFVGNRNSRDHIFALAPTPVEISSLSSWAREWKLIVFVEIPSSGLGSVSQEERLLNAIMDRVPASLRFPLQVRAEFVGPLFSRILSTFVIEKGWREHSDGYRHELIRFASIYTKSESLIEGIRVQLVRSKQPGSGSDNRNEIARLIVSGTWLTLNLPGTAENGSAVADLDEAISFLDECLKQAKQST